jgi:prepilin signal peptidase PulO-like enzyme (type II secretory pathway)
LVEWLGTAGRTAASTLGPRAYRPLVAVSDLTLVDPGASDPSAPESTDRALTPRVEWVIPPGIFAAVSLVYLTLSKFGAGGLGAAWSVAQLLLVFVACFDVVTHRIPNRATIPAMAVVVVLRAVFATSTVPEALLAGVGGFAAFFFLCVVTRGGFGMGDVKLAGLLGLLLGKAVLPALLVGIVVGGIASAIVVLAVRGGRKQAIAYGPYLCFGAALGVLAFSPPPLV